MNAIRRYLRARRFAKLRRAADELQLVIFWQELGNDIRRGDW